MTDERALTINVPVLARVEGEGALELTVRDGAVEDLRLRIFEPPRMFEKFLEGRSYTELPDMVARICGICPVAYQMSAVHAIERAFGAEPGQWVRDMRRLIYCGEWIQSHALHIHLLAAPDFLGFETAIEMAKAHGDVVRRGLQLQSLGNRLIGLFGGRSVHPVGVRPGGFFRAPDLGAIEQLARDLEQAYVQSGELVRWLAELSLPEDRQSFTSVALRHPAEYPMNEGRLTSDHGLDIDIAEFEQHIEEQQVPHSTALHARLHGAPYLVGPLARLNLNQDRLPSEIQALLGDAGFELPSANMFASIVARAVELHFAIYEARRLLSAYRQPDEVACDVIPRAGVGYGCTEAPRGALWHRYEFDDRGRIVHARIVPPTSQNQARIEEDLKVSLENFGLNNDDDLLRRRGETVIRNYDPCISCATHFLRLRIRR